MSDATSDTRSILGTSSESSCHFLLFGFEGLLHRDYIIFKGTIKFITLFYSENFDFQINLRMKNLMRKHFYFSSNTQNISLSKCSICRANELSCSFNTAKFKQREKS